MDLRGLRTDAIERWLQNYGEAIALGMRVGMLDQQKAQKFRLELIRRGRA